MVTVWRLNIDDGPGGLVVDDPMYLVDELESFSVGEGPIYIFVEEMDEEKFANLGEFDGF